MNPLERSAFDPDDIVVEPFRVTPGFIGFIGLLLLPAIAAVAIYLGAWVVADDVYAAERPAAATSAQEANFAVVTEDGKHVAGWKKTLVGICPAH
jgi:hypothetical protein